MSTPTKPDLRPQAPTKDQLRAMLAQAVRDTQPELNPVTDQAPVPKAMRRARPTKGGPATLAAKGREGRGPPVRLRARVRNSLRRSTIGRRIGPWFY